jgi:hypothetical protein
MENNYPLLSVNGKAQLGCHAALPGTGPIGSICSGCVLLVPQGSKFVCGKYQRMTGRKPKPISPNSSACRYFQPRRRFSDTPAQEV